LLCIADPDHRRAAWPRALARSRERRPDAYAGSTVRLYSYQDLLALLVGRHSSSAKLRHCVLS